MSLKAEAADFGLSLEEFDLVVGALGREPNRLEAAIFGALWSEHCGYKNSRPLLRRLPTEGPQVLQGPGENAGVVDLGDGYAVAFKMESHNHPSAVEPVQGAATGVGGILRDIFAMGARPVAVLDSLFFGPPREGRNRYLLGGVVQGISQYGNAVGVPTVGGAVFFHPSYSENPLVNVMALGYLRHEALQSGTVGEVGSKLVYVGSRTGRDGLGGAVFASANLSEASEFDRPAVQVGDPFMEKLLLEACLEAIQEGLVVGVQDMGAAGLSSSVGEMAQRAGKGVDLFVDRVPRREAGMSALEVMLSESQERMVLAAKPEKEAALMALLARWELEAVVIGAVMDHGYFRIIEDGEVKAEMPVAALNSPPTYVREGREDPKIARAREAAIDVPVPEDLGSVLIDLLASPTVASKEAVYRQYDHQVMTNTVILPGEAGAALLRIKGTTKGVAAATDCNPRYCYLDPYEGAKAAIAEAARNVACVGAKPLAITDNLNLGNPTRPEVYYQLERAIEGLRDACLALDTPVTGGNVSLYNEYRSGDGDEVIAIHPTPNVGMIGVVEDVSKRATMSFKRDGDVVLLLGENTGEFGASEYLARVHGLEIGRPPRLDLARERVLQEAVLALVHEGLCDTAHDASEGGLAVALAEMAVKGGRGISVTLEDDLRPDALLYGEAQSRIVVAVRPENLEGARAVLSRFPLPYTVLGGVGGEGMEVAVRGERLYWPLAALREAYERPLGEALA
jgi:phosphoribosylformylglycinamidine synthase subunit PurL